MADVRSFRVFDNKGYVGELMAPARFLDGRSQKTIRLEDGREIVVNAADLKVREDGSFQLTRAALPPADAPAPPSASPDGAEFYEQNYHIERVPVGRIVDVAPTQRQEGDTLILPVVEEVLVYEKKIFLKEEIRIAMSRKPVEEVRKIQQPADPPPRPGGSASQTNGK